MKSAKYPLCTVYTQCYPSLNTQYSHPLHLTLGRRVHCSPITSHCRFSGKEAEGLSDKRGVLQSCKVGGRQHCQFTEVTIMDIHFSTLSQNTHVVHRCHVLQHSALCITASGIPSHSAHQAVWRAPADRAALPVAN